MVDFESADASWAMSTRPRIDAHPPPPRGPRTDDAAARTRDELRELRIRREQLTNEKLALELDHRAGLLVERAEVDFLLGDLGNRWRAALEQLPDRLAPEIFGLSDLAAIRAKLESAALGVLDNFASDLDRAAAALDACAPADPGHADEDMDHG